MILRLAWAKAVATNLLVVTGALYALRGAAVAAFAATMSGSSFFTIAVVAAATILMLPVVLGGAILLGVLDAGVDLRRRLANPPAGD
jgi:hypothetical protein